MSVAVGGADPGSQAWAITCIEGQHAEAPVDKHGRQLLMVSGVRSAAGVPHAECHLQQPDAAQGATGHGLHPNGITKTLVH